MSTDQKTAQGASTQTFLSSLIINSIVASVELAAFIFLKNRFRKVYQPRSYLPPEYERSNPLAKGPFRWIMTVIKADPEQIIPKNGLDAYYFIRYLTLMLKILTPFSVISWAVLFPVYAASPNAGRTGLDRFTYGDVATTQQKRLAAPCVLIWLLNIWIFYLVRRELIIFIQKRQDFLMSTQHASLPQCKTVLLTGVPPKMLNMENLTTFASYLPGGAKQIWMCRDLKRLPDLYDRRLNAFNKLEGSETKLAKLVSLAKVKETKAKKPKANSNDAPDPDETSNGVNGDANGVDVEGKPREWERYVSKKDRPQHRIGTLGLVGKKVDSIDWAKDEIVTMTREIDEARSELSQYSPHNSVFIEFNTQIAAHMFAQSLAHHMPLAMTGRYIEVSPEDVIWYNLNIPPVQLRFRHVISMAITAALIIFWAIPVAFVGTVSNLTGLCVSVSWMAWVCKLPSPVPGIIQGILPPVLLAVLFLLLPIVLRILIIFEGVPLQSLVEVKLMKRYSIFLVIHGFLIVTLSSGLTQAIPQITKNPGSALTLLAQNLPRASTFFLTYIMTTMLAGAAGSLLQIGALAVYYIKMYLLASTPRSIFRIRYKMGNVSWGTLFPNVTLLVVIALSYAVVSPIVNGLACFGFAMYWFVFKYLFIFVYDMPDAGETGGLFFPLAIDQVFVGLYVQQIFVATLFFFAQDNKKNQSGIIEGAFTIVLLAVTVLIHSIFRSNFYPLMQYLSISLAPQIEESLKSLPKSPSQPVKPSIEKEESLKSSPISPSQLVKPSIEKADVSERSPNDPEQGINSLQLGKPITGKAEAELEPELEQAPHAFDHPATWENLPPVWVPNDVHGVIESELADLHQAGIKATVDGATMNEQGKVTITRNPPGGLVDFEIPPTD